MRQVLKGSTNVSVDVYIIDSTDGTPETGVVFNTSGIDLEYRRAGAAVVNITEADLATPALTDAHADGGFLTIGHGLYRLDLPDAACATGAETVSIQGTVTGMIVLPQTIQLVDFDPEDGVRLGLTALPNAAADAGGGIPISDAGGLDLDALNTNINDIETDTNELQVDWVNGGRLDLLLDAIPTTAMRGTDNAALASVLGALNDAASADDPTTADTAMQYIKQLINILIGAAGIATLRAAAAPANAVSLSEMIRSIYDDTNEIQTDDIPSLLPTALVGGRIDATVDATGMEAGAVDNIWDEAASGHTTLGTVGQMLNGLATRTGAVNDAGPVVGDFDVDGFTEVTNDHFNGMTMTFTSGALTGQGRTITDYTGVGQNCVFAEAWTNAPANNDEFIITAAPLAGADILRLLRLFISILDQSTGQVDSGSFAAGAIDAAAIAANAIGASELATDAINEIVDQVWEEAQADHVAAGSFGVTATEIADILVDTAVIGALGAGLSNIPWNASWDVEVESEADDALVAFFTDAATLVNLIWDEAQVETTGAPAITGTMRAFMEWWAALSRNRMTQTATTSTLRDDADAAALATSTVSDDGTTFVRGEWST